MKSYLISFAKLVNGILFHLNVLEIFNIYRGFRHFFGSTDKTAWIIVKNRAPDIGGLLSNWG